MHALRSLQREHETTAGTNKFDPLPWTWKMPRPGFSGFEDIHDARAFYAQQYADDMRKKAEQSLAQNGIKSEFYPYRFDSEPKEEPGEEPPLTPAAALLAFSRLSTWTLIPQSELSQRSGAMPGMQAALRFLLSVICSLLSLSPNGHIHNISSTVDYQPAN
jgi:hypothetical protein